MIGGFFLVDCTTHEQALAIAQRCPAAEWCTVEVQVAGALLRRQQRMRRARGQPKPWRVENPPRRSSCG